MKAACDSTDRVVATITPDQHDLPTPCVDWNVRQLANHLLATLHLGRALLSDQMPTVQSGPGQVPAEDLIGEDLVAAYRDGAQALIAATTSDAVNRMHVTPLGEMPAPDSPASLRSMSSFTDGTSPRPLANRQPSTTNLPS